MSDSSAHHIAAAIHDGFEQYFATFQAMTVDAQRRFRKGDQAGCHQTSKDRLNLYDDQILMVKQRVLDQAGVTAEQQPVWRSAKAEYSLLIADSPLREIAETFFNSIYCKFFDHRHIDNDYMYVWPDTEKRSNASATECNLLNYFHAKDSLSQLLNNILDSYDFGVPYEDRDRDVNSMRRVFLRELPGDMVRNPDAYVVIHKSMFYRGMAAYLVGKVISEESSAPFVVPILHNGENGIFVDSLIFDPDELSVIFSFTHAYFKVDAPVPAEVVRFLKDLMPSKTDAELYNAIGFNHHGKTEFYRSFLTHLDNTHDKFVITPGIKGMVMLVFTLPSLNVVFKVIKDKFTAPKDMTREVVKQQYMLASRHDWVGRMADTQEYANFAFPKHRFSNEVLAELLKEAPSLVSIEGDTVSIKHLYIERYTIPLNLYLEQASDEEAQQAIEEYGLAIKQLAAANIFPGDMLFKNFGVTRHKRVVLYDYDEISLLTECNFRKIPPPRTPEDELSSEPWYSIGPHDVFPEEFPTFLFGANARIRKLFLEFHAGIFDAEQWQALQRDISIGITRNVAPYKKPFKRSSELPKPLT